MKGQIFTSKTILKFPSSKVLRLAMITVAISLTTFRTWSADCVSLPSGLVAWWPGEESGIDVAGANNGTLAGDVTFGSGKVGQAFNFDGGSGLVVAQTNALPITNTFTIEFWAFPNASRAGTLEDTGGASGLSGQRYAIGPKQCGSNAGVGVSVGTNGVSVFEHGANYLPSLLVYEASVTAWTHVAVVYVNKQPRLYINGALVRVGLTSGRPFVFPSAAFGNNDENYGPYSGLLDEVSIYNRVLSDAEIAAIYSAGSVGKCKPPLISAQPRNQVGYWGKSVIFTVTALGFPPLSYQWQKDKVPITGATGASLVLTNLQMSDAGNYSIVVTNSLGSTTSSNAYLMMNPAGVSLALYSGITIDGVVGLTYGIEYNTDLSNTNSWRGMANVTLSAPTQLWFDLLPAEQPQRYYRVVPGPISIP